MPSQFSDDQKGRAVYEALILLDSYFWRGQTQLRQAQMDLLACLREVASDYLAQGVTHGVASGTRPPA